MQNKTKIFIDIAPLACFFIAYKAWDIVVATAALTAVTVVLTAITYFKTKKISVTPLVTGAVVAVFGTLTVVLHDDFYIKIKPTLVNLVFAGILLGGLAMNRIFIKYLLSGALELDERGWRIISLRYGLFFIFLAILNEFIWRNFSTDFWVNFKVFGMFLITISFTLLQTPIIKKHSLVR